MYYIAHILNYALYDSYLYFPQNALFIKNCTIFNTCENNANTIYRLNNR